MLSIVILLIGIILLALAYRFYSPYIALKLGLDPARETPSHTMKDGVDYYPAKAPILFGHHFASIAGAAPIVGPIIAITYGWGVTVLWIILGGIFLGALHDFSALIVSIRHRGRSIGEVLGEHMGRAGKMMFLLFLWATMVLLVAVYLDVVIATFISVPQAATAAMLFIPLAVIFGLLLYRLRIPMWPATILGVIFLFICMIAGAGLPIILSYNVWMIILVVYIFIASVTPVWILLQPRDYLSSFLLYALLIVAIVGVFAAHPEVNMPIFTSFIDPELGPLFPILFVTVACGAISGFHSAVSAGTTTKQLDKERDARPIGYGAMLVESLLAMLALLVVMNFNSADYAQQITTKGPVTLFSEGLGSFLATLGIDISYGTSFAALAVSAFVLTTLDTATRLGRFAFQEFFAPRENETPSVLFKNRFIGTTVTVAAAALFALSGGWRVIWPIFGSANQLLAALALLAVALWLKSLARSTTFLKIPMLIMFAITLSALSVIFYENMREAHYVLAISGAALFLLAVVLLIMSWSLFLKKE